MTIGWTRQDRAVKLRWLAAVPLLVVGRALRVRLSVGGRRRYWQDRYQPDRRSPPDRQRPGARSAAGPDDSGCTELFVLALGDSLTQGIGSSRPATSWLALFAAHLQVTTGRTVRLHNRAVYGARVAQVLAEQLPPAPEVDLVVLCIGANDAGRTPPAEFRQSLRAICDQLPVGSIVGDVPEFQWGSRVAAAAELAAIVRAVVAEYPGLVLAQVERFTADTRIATDLAGDFFHPNNRGYRRIAQAFIQASPASSALAAIRAGINSAPGRVETD